METAIPKNRGRQLFRTLRPLFGWTLLVLMLYGIRTHQRLMQETRLHFTASVKGHSDYSEPTATFDGMPISSSDNISLGRHEFVVRHPKGETFTTNLFIWYGKHVLGEINLKRAQGTLALQVNPPAARVTIHGQEFSQILTNSPGLMVSVPTDEYFIEASSAHWRQESDVTIFEGGTSPVRIAPSLGSAALTCNQPGASFELFTRDEQLVEAGEFPATIGELPAGNYKLIAAHHQNRMEKNVYVKAGAPSDLRTDFIYGAATFESDPPGATVTSRRKEYGVTPITLSELTLGTFEFSLALSDYETVAGTVAVAVNETNSFRTKLVSRYYTIAMDSARRSYANKAYDRAAELAMEALRHKPDDIEAVNLQRDATGYAHIAQAADLARRGEFTEAIKEVNVALTILPNKADAQALIADYTTKEQQRIEQQKKRDAELADEQKRRDEAQAAQQQRQQRINHLNQIFEAVSRTYENAPMFASHELSTTNRLGAVGSGINQALLNIEPKFDLVKFDWPRPDTFTLQVRQRIGIGSRQCLIVGVQVSDDETQLRFKVFEYDQPGNITLFGGAVTLSTQITSTSQDPNMIRAKAEQMHVRILEGIKLVIERIKEAAAM